MRLCDSASCTDADRDELSQRDMVSIAANAESRQRMRSQAGSAPCRRVIDGGMV
jgi:hypothetical protein